MKNNRNVEWLGGRAPWEMSSDEFMGIHRTGFISSTAYSMYEETGGLSWIGGVKRFGHLMQEIDGVEYRRTGDKNNYVKCDDSGEILRGSDGRAVLMSSDEIRQANRAEYDQTIVAFIDQEPVALVSNEFGAVGVWCEARAQRRGIGTNLLKMFLEENKDMQIGQMTNSGENAVRRLHANFVEQHQPAHAKAKSPGLR